LTAALKRMPAAAKGDRLERFVIDVHSIKSSSASIGAPELSELAKRMEQAGKEKNLAYIESHMADFIYRCESTLESIEAYFSGEGGSETDREVSRIEETWIQRMFNACENMDSAEAELLLEEVRGLSFSDEDKELIESIEEYVNQYDYDDVMSLLGGLLR